VRNQSRVSQGRYKILRKSSCSVLPTALRPQKTVPPPLKRCSKLFRPTVWDSWSFVLQQLTPDTLTLSYCVGVYALLSRNMHSAGQAKPSASIPLCGTLGFKTHGG